jgi:hypothetical protein
VGAHQVATEQLAEYASAKKTEASALASQAEALRALFGGATAEQLQQQFAVRACDTQRERERERERERGVVS